MLGMLVVFSVAATSVAADLLGLRGEALSNLNLKRSTSWSSSSPGSSLQLYSAGPSLRLDELEFKLAYSIINLSL